MSPSPVRCSTTWTPRFVVFISNVGQNSTCSSAMLVRTTARGRQQLRYRTTASGRRLHAVQHNSEWSATAPVQNNSEWSSTTRSSERPYVVDDKWWTLSRRFRPVTRATVSVSRSALPVCDTRHCAGGSRSRAAAQLQEEDCLSEDASSSPLTMATRWVEFLHF